ncbi:MAG: hypothetical protein J6S31_07040, partial [Lachnospiraceae bacterium]|nr:hypothetical protein [Lachnospiraceae bacterium]
LIFSVMAFFFTLFLSGMADKAWNPHVNDSYEIEGTDLTIRYSDKKGNGIFEGDPITGVLKVEGSFGHDWGIALEGDYLYLNEYRNSTLGMVFCQLVRINLQTYEKEILMRNTILRGQCTSGELVCVSDILMPALQPQTNELCRLYAMTDSKINLQSDGGTVLFIDPVDAEILYETEGEGVLSDEFTALYLDHSLEEIRKEESR